MKISAFLIYLLLIPVFAAASSESPAAKGTIKGRWISPQHGPMHQGVVYLFDTREGPPPAIEKYWRVPDVMAVVDKEGNFRTDLEAGNYYLGPLKRKVGVEPGPPEEGDFFFFSMESPGKPKIYTIKAGELSDIGTITAAELFTPTPNKGNEGLTIIEGSVFDEDGKPVSGSLVFAYQTPNTIGKPMFVSNKTSSEGKFRLLVSKGGEYYLKTRKNYGGGAPEPGEVIGIYGDKDAQPVRVETGRSQKGITIKGKKFSRQGDKKRQDRQPENRPKGPADRP